MPAWFAPVAAAVAGSVASSLFGGGDDDGGSTEQRTVIDPRVREMQDRAFSTATDLAGQPYVKAPFNTVAPLSGYTQAGMQSVSDNQGQWMPGMQRAYGTAQGAIDASTGARTYTPGEWNNRMAQRYMSPYVRSALNPVARETRLGYDMDRQRMQSNAASEGALGGSRQALLEAENMRNKERAVSDVYAQGYDRAYGNAQGAFGRDADRALDTARLNEQVRGQDLDRQLTGANILSSLTGQVQSLSDNDINNMFRAGDIEQGHNQMQLNEDYRQWVEQRDWGERALDYYLRAIGGAGATNIASQTEHTLPASNPIAQGAGLGLTAYGMYQQNKEPAAAPASNWNTGSYFTNPVQSGNRNIWGDA